MSAVASLNTPQPSNQAPKGKKSNKKKKQAGKSKVNGDDPKSDAGKDTLEAEADGGELDEPEHPVTTDGSSTKPVQKPSIDLNGLDAALARRAGHSEIHEDGSKVTANGSGFREASSAADADISPTPVQEITDINNAEAESLRATMTEVQSKHERELSALRGQLEETKSKREHAETQYRNLLGRVGTIKAQLEERLRADAEELSQAKGQIEELEGQTQNLKGLNESLQREVGKKIEEEEQRSKELSSLRNRMNLSQQNWTQERDDLISKEANMREEFEAARQAMLDWEVLAMEERSVRETLGDRVTDLEEQLSAQKEAYESAASERDAQSMTVDGLQRALQEIQEARKLELRELVEANQSQVEALQKELRDSEQKASESKTKLESAQRELERALPFEKEVKEKNLLIGKLRHEAVILNDHLTKALRALKKGKPEDNVDRQIVTNYFLHFLALDRADPKKFEILKIIAAVLDWNDEQREQAGLARPGGGGGTLRAPLTPFLRTPSSPALTKELLSPDANQSKESLAELWSNFLEQEAQEGSKSSRSPSVSSGPSGPKLP
ncbi:MAG: hypothetical protein M1824_006062 [Vezdaea acicularis]|nr:MAG: hypothetical protein M1824_006062 [Vezdaea acicularis]